MYALFNNVLTKMNLYTTLNTVSDPVDDLRRPAPAPLCELVELVGTGSIGPHTDLIDHFYIRIDMFRIDR